MTAICRSRSSTTSSAAARPSRSRVDGRRSLVYLDGPGRRAESPPSRIGARECPTASAFRGIEFVEFAADEAGGGRACRAVPTGSASARPAGTSPRMSRCSGRATSILVINTEREGFAHSSYRGSRHVGLRHRPQGRGCRGDGRARQGRWARSRSSRRCGPGELTIPAIRGVGGGVIYFIDQRPALARVWDVEFVPVDADRSAVRRAG